MLTFHPSVQCFIHSSIYFREQTLLRSHYLPGTKLGVEKPDVLKNLVSIRKKKEK